jgi:hypothetical protein
MSLQSDSTRRSFGPVRLRRADAGFVRPTPYVVETQDALAFFGTLGEEDELVTSGLEGA